MNKHYIFYGALIAAFFIALASWLKAHDAWRDAAAFQRGQDAAIHQARDAFNQAQQHSDQVGKDEKKDVAAIQKAAADPKSSSAENVRALVQALLPHAQVETVQVNGNPLLAVPDTPENREDIVQVKAACDICSVSLAARNQQLADAQTQIGAQKNEISAITLERDKYKKAASSGSGFWARTREWSIRIGLLAGGIEAGRLSKR